MKKLIPIAAIVVVVLAYLFWPRSSQVPDDGLGWLTDISAARETAKEQDRPILIFFTGSDWCGWCRKLSREIFSQQEFHVYADDNLVLLKVDFPRRTPQPPEVRRANQALARKFSVKGLPTIVLLDKYANEVGRTGYQHMTPSQYVDHLESFLAKAS
jgi:protein disulfide-isomerase